MPTRTGYAVIEVSDETKHQLDNLKTPELVSYDKVIQHIIKVINND